MGESRLLHGRSMEFEKWRGKLGRGNGSVGGSRDCKWLWRWDKISPCTVSSKYHIRSRIELL